MDTIIGLVLVFIFLALSTIHFYWGFGGRWGMNSVIPSDGEHKQLFNPGISGSFIVAMALLSMALFILIQLKLIVIPLPAWLIQNGLWLIASVFFIRAVGDFRYIGFTKKLRNTKFGTLDTTFFSPLCLVISLLLFSFQILLH